MVRKVAVIMGSDSDWSVVKGACAQLKALDIPFEAHILSAHRTPAGAAEFAKSARANGFGVILCAAGMAASSSLKFSSAVPCACVFRRRKSPFCGPPSLYYIQFTAKKHL